MTEPGRLLTRGFLLVWAASLMYSLGFHGTAAALSLYAVSLGANETQVGLLIGLFALTALLGRTVVGWQLDRGYKRLVLAVGALLFVASSVGYALVSTVAPLLGLRLLNGAGHAAGMTAGQTLATDNAPAARRGEALGVHGLTQTLALGVAPAIGMAIAFRFGFVTLFLTTAACSLLAVGIALLIPEPRLPGARPQGRFFNTAVIRPGVVLAALQGAFGAVIALVAVHAARTGLENPGFFFVTYAAGLAVAQVSGGRLSDRRGRAAAILPGLALAMAGTWSIALASNWWLLPAGTIFGLGIGLAQSNLIALAADWVPPAQRGSAIATAGMFLELGISSGATIGGMIGQAAGLPMALFVLGALPGVALLVLLSSRWGRQTLRTPDRANDHALAAVMEAPVAAGDVARPARD